MPEQLDFRDPEWVAEQLNIDKNAVYRYLNDGVLPGLQLGRKWLISESTLVEWLKAEERRQTQERQLAFRGPGVLRYTARASRALEMAREDALARNHNFIGTEHLLSALLAASNPNAGAALIERMGAGRDLLLAAIGAASPDGTVEVEGPFGLTPRAKKAIELATTEADALNHQHIGCEHFLLGLLAQGDGIAAVVLKEFGITLEKARVQVREFVVAAQAPGPA